MKVLMGNRLSVDPMVDEAKVDLVKFFFFIFEVNKKAIFTFVVLMQRLQRPIGVEVAFYEVVRI